MTLKYAILGFLTLEPLSGYDLKTKYFDGSVANFWPADQAQIYRTLERMQQSGWVKSQLKVQTHRPNRKTYTITEAGKTALHRWLAESRPLPAERMPFLVQLYFARHLSHKELITLLQDQRQQHVARLAIYQTVTLPSADDPIQEQQLRFGRFTLDFGRRYEQMQIDWLDSILAQIKAT